MQSVFKTFGVTQALFAKMQYSCPEKYGSVVAPWFNQINTFLFGGITQHGEFVGNVCADLNGMGGGARAHRDGEHSMAPIFAAMADIGEQEIIEEDVPLPAAHFQEDQARQPGLRQASRRHGLRDRRHGQGHPAVGLRDRVQRLEVPGRARPIRRLRLCQRIRSPRSRA